MSRPREDILVRLEKHKWVIPETNCWRFLGSSVRGYCLIWYEGKQILVHRLSMHLFKGFDLDSNELVCHKEDICKYKDCWNPEHLYVGTHRDNMNDWSNSITHCPQGHEFTKENTRIRHVITRGSQTRNKVCRECEKLNKRIYRAKIR